MSHPYKNVENLTLLKLLKATLELLKEVTVKLPPSEM
jgi:hypothetical protein